MDDRNGRYVAMIKLPSGKQKYLGRYDTVEEAARAYARKYLEVHEGPPELQTVAERMATGSSGEGNDMEIDLEQWRSSRSATGYRGVRMQDGRYKTQIWLPSGTQKHLGMYDTAEEAASVYARKYLEVHGGGATVAEDEVAAVPAPAEKLMITATKPRAARPGSMQVVEGDLTYSTLLDETPLEVSLRFGVPLDELLVANQVLPYLS